MSDFMRKSSLLTTTDFFDVTDFADFWICFST